MNITGDEFEGVVAGGSAAGGNYVWLTYRAGGKDMTVICEKSRVGVLMTGWSAAAAKARADRMKVNPEEAHSIGADTAYAVPIVGASVGRSTVPGTAILDMLVKAPDGTAMDLYGALDAEGLEKLRAACDRALAMLEKQGRAVKAN